MVRAIVAPKLAYPVLLGGPFLESNKIVIDHELGRVTAKDERYQLLPAIPLPPPVSQEVPVAVRVLEPREEMRGALQELEEQTKARRVQADRRSTTGTRHKHFARTLRNRIEILAVWDDLSKYEREIKEEFADRFPADIPHVTRLPDDVFHRFRLKDPEKVIKCRSYACPKKYKDAWRQLLEVFEGGGEHGGGCAVAHARGGGGGGGSGCFSADSVERPQDKWGHKSRICF